MFTCFYKCANVVAPSYLICDVLTPAASIRTRESRITAVIYYIVLLINSDLFKQSFEYRASALWNSLPSNLIERHQVTTMLRSRTKE